MSSGICLWSDLSLSEVKQLWNCSTRNDIKETLCAKLGYDFCNLHSKEKILLDLHFHTLLFAKDRKYNEEQTSAIFSIIKRTHEKAVETPFGNLDDTFAYFKELLARHSVKRPPFCIHLFPVQEVVAITDYVVNTYFRHFKLYKYTFTPKIVMNVSINYADVIEDEVPVEEEGVTNGSMASMEKEAGDTGASPEPLSLEMEDTPAMKELKQIVEAALDEQITKLRVDVDSKLKINEESLMHQLVSGKDTGTTNTSATKTKGKKGK